MDATKFEIKDQEGLPPEGGPDIEMDSMEGTVDRELHCTGASQGAVERDPPTVSLESLTEKVSTLGFRKPKNSRYGAAKRAKVSKQAGPPGGETAGGDTRPPPGGQPHPGIESVAGPGKGAPSPSTSKTGGNRWVRVSAKGRRGHSGRQAG
jgi:hypothetical protein